MFNRIHRKLGTAGFIISIVALIAALGGGAYAASGGLTGKQKKEVEKIAKSVSKPDKTGPTGAAGATGPAGPAGAKGDTGATGLGGTNGTNGKSVVLVNEEPENCPGEKGFTYEIQGSGNLNEVCSSGGAGGLPATLGAEQTETGTWEMPTFGIEGFTAISFPIPLAAELDAAHMILVQHPAVSIPAQCEFGATPASAAHPEADPGFLCIFRGFFQTEEETHLEPASKPFAGGGPGSGTTGAILNAASEVALENRGVGTWAVTGAIGP